MANTRGRPRNSGVLALKAAEPVITHRRLRHRRRVDIRRMEELQRRCAPEASPGCANMDSRTLRPGNNAACNSATDISATSSQPRPSSSAAPQHRVPRGCCAGIPPGGLDRSSRQALITQLQHQLRFDLPYHDRYSFHYVAVTWWKGHSEVVHTHPSGGAHPRQSGCRATVLARTTGGDLKSEYSSSSHGGMCTHDFVGAILR